MSTTATRPINVGACDAADEAIYAAHENDERPNALFDADGNRLLLDGDDPCQEHLREEWFRYYEAAGGEVEDDETPSNDKPDTPIQPCPEDDELVLVELVEELNPFIKGPQGDPSADRRQWVSLGPLVRMELKRFDVTTSIYLRARVAWKSGRRDDLAGQTVHFRLEPQPGNRENLPDSIAAHFLFGADDAPTATTDADGWTDLVGADLSTYGGDRFRLRATLDGAASGGLETGVFTVWRKVYYSVDTMLAHDGSKRELGIDWSRLESVYLDRYIVFERIGTDTLPPFKRIMENSELGAFVANLPQPDPHQHPHLHFVICNIVADYDNVVEKVITRQAPRSGVFEIVNGTGREPNPGDWVSEAHWKRGRGEWAPFPLSNLRLDEKVGAPGVYRVYADSRDVPGLDAHRRFKLKLKLRLLDTLGGFQQDTRLAIASRFSVFRPIDADGILHVCMHESGHALGLAPATTPEGSPNPHVDESRGHHCRYGDMDCVMHPGGDYEAHEPCPTCTDALRARRLTELPVSGGDPF